MTLAETWDLPKLAISDIDFDDEDGYTAIDITNRRRAVEEDDELVEPSLAGAPFFIEFDEPARLDPERAGLIWELVPAVTRSIEVRSPMASLAFHLLPALMVMLLPLLVIEPPPPIPVQLVFEEPPPPVPEQPQQSQAQPKMETGRLSSVDTGVVKPNLDLGRSADPLQPPSAGEQQQDPAETKTAVVPPPPVPLPKPAPPKDKPAPIQMPKPSGANVPRHEETPHETAHSSRYAGAAANRDEYLAYLVTLTRQHINLLPMSIIGDRHGETVISVVVYANGLIGPIAVVRGSGYAEIDQRIEAMVAAVGKFPPLPQWYQGNAVQLELTLRFPDALTQAQ